MLYNQSKGDTDSPSDPAISQHNSIPVLESIASFSQHVVETHNSQITRHIHPKVEIND